MSFDNCATCGHEFTKIGNDIPHSDGAMDIIHGGGVCRSCYLKSGYKECGECGALAYSNMKFCSECGTQYPELKAGK